MIHYVYKTVTGFLKDLSIKQKLMLSYFVLIVIPLGTLTLLTYTRSAETVRQNMTSIATQALEQAGISVAGKLEAAINVVNMIYFNTEIQENLSRELSQNGISRQIDDEKRMGSYLRNFQNEQEIFRIRLYINRELYYSSENINFFSIREIEDTDLYEKAAADRSRVYWNFHRDFKYPGLSETQNIISAAKVMTNYSTYGEIIGLECIDMQEKTIRKILENSMQSLNGLMLLVDEEGNVISCSNDTLRGEYERGIRESLPLVKNELEWIKIGTPEHMGLVGFMNVKYSNWKLVAVVPMANILLPGIQLRNYSLALMLAIGVLAYLIALAISVYMEKRIYKLIQTMNRAEKGDLSVKVTVGGKDEIGELENKFNNMLGKMAGLIDEKYKVGQEAKISELKALQAQINPHFLYNTLELINCRAGKYRANDIRDLVNSLARFYKLSLSKGRDIVSIADEIAHVETYIYIQNQRFDGRIGLETDVDERVLEYSILKLVLQPIVENAVIHGILEKESKTGTIKITGTPDGDVITLEIQDDGVGMDETALQNIFADTGRKDGHGYGVKNVNNRIKIIYGEQYGLAYRSKPGSGTTVAVRIPAVRHS